MYNTLQGLADKLLNNLRQHKLSICTAESVTAGYLCGTMTRASGISSYLKGGLVCYHPSIKIDILNIPEDIVSYRYAVNEKVAQKMAESAANFFNADIGISTTGFADKFEDYSPEAYIGIFVRNVGCNVFHLYLEETKTREEARLRIVEKGLSELVSTLEGFECNHEGLFVM